MKKIKYIVEQSIRLLFQSLLGIKIFNFPVLSNIRDIIYSFLFSAGKGLHVGHNVYIDREHKKYDGSIKIGEHVLFAHNCHIDYTGHLIIEDNVKIADGVHILTHARDIKALREHGLDINNQNTLVIGEGAYIGTHSLILPSCHYIGKNAIIGAGSIVTKDVPDNQLFCGIAAKFVKEV